MIDEVRGRDDWPGPADVEYFTQAQASGWADMLRAFVRFTGPAPGQRVLDVGSGPGLLPRIYAADHAELAVACDDSWPMLQRAAELSVAAGSKISLLAGAATCLPVAERSFDLVCATNLLFLLPDPAAGLAELVRVANPGGRVAFLNPSESMCLAAAEEFAAARGLAGFGRFSFMNYGRLAEAHHRLALPAWLALAQSSGLVDLRSESRSGGLVLLVAGLKQSSETYHG